MTRWHWLMLGSIVAGPQAVSAQVRVTGQVVVATTEDPIIGATVASRCGGTSTVTGRRGTFVLPLKCTVDTIAVRFIGYEPQDVVVTGDIAQNLRIKLVERPAVLNELVAREEVAFTGIPASTRDGYTLSADALRATPAAVEPDPIRALSQIPAVSFSTPLSARPVIRGYDASESVFRLDGYEIINPYHLGRVFSSFPQLAVREVRVAPSGTGVDVGGSVSGAIEVTGRSSTAGEGLASLEVSPLASTGSIGTESATAPLKAFVAGRVVYTSLVTSVANTRLPYDFVDVYSRLSTRLGSRIDAEVTAFTSSDNLLDQDAGSGQDWSSRLLGARVNWSPSACVQASASASYNDFSLQGTNLQDGLSRVDLDNNFERIAADIRAEFGCGSVRLLTGTSLGQRRIDNLVRRTGLRGLAGIEQTASLSEQAAFADLRVTRGTIAFDAGARVDRSATSSLLQADLRFATAVGKGALLRAGVRRSGRLFQLLSQPVPEPSLILEDYWFNSGVNGTPAPSAWHGTLDLELARGITTAKAGIYASRGRGIGEVVSALTAPTAEGPFRFGDSRILGVELQVGRRFAGMLRSAVISYIGQRSERRWDGTTWVPWTLQREHTVRFALQARTSRIEWTAVGDLATGIPFTPVLGLIPTGVGSASAGVERNLSYRYGDENSARSQMTARVDLGARIPLRGPFGSRMELSASITNAGFGPVAPRVPVTPLENFTATDQRSPTGATLLQYQRVFSLPAVPSVALRVDF